MRIQLGLGAMGAVQRRRLFRRGSLALGIVASIFSFVTIDLARNDAIFTTGLDVVESNTPPVIEFTLSNTSDTPMTELETHYSIYDRAGKRIGTKGEKAGWDTIEDSYFAPLGMTIGPKSSKFGIIPISSLEKPPSDIGYAYVCAVFKGSFGIDQIRTELLLVSLPGVGFGQRTHDTDVYYISTPDCLAPEQISTN